MVVGVGFEREFCGGRVVAYGGGCRGELGVVVFDIRGGWDGWEGVGVEGVDGAAGRMAVR